MATEGHLPLLLVHPDICQLCDDCGVYRDVFTAAATATVPVMVVFAAIATMATMAAMAAMTTMTATAAMGAMAAMAAIGDKCRCFRNAAIARIAGVIIRCQ